LLLQQPKGVSSKSQSFRLCFKDEEAISSLPVFSSDPSNHYRLPSHFVKFHFHSYRLKLSSRYFCLSVGMTEQDFFSGFMQVLFVTDYYRGHLFALRKVPLVIVVLFR
jgi:hypothetical protein